MINSIKNNSVIFCKNRDKLEILKELNEKSLFLNLSFFDYNDYFVTFNHQYFFFLKDKFNIGYDLAKKIRKYFIYLNNKEYKSKRLTELQEIKKELLANKIIEINELSKYKNRIIYNINNMPVPAFFNSKDIVNINISKKQDTPINLYKTEDIDSQCMKAYLEVVNLLENGISINDIVILNTSSEDDFTLKKLFNDAKIPYTLNKKIKLNTYPEVIKLIRTIKDNGYLVSKEYLKKLLQKNQDKLYMKPIIQIYNNYTDFDLENHPDILINILNNQSFNPTKYYNCINIYDIDSFKYTESKHYIVLNFNDNSLPKKANVSHYLNDLELKELDYVSLEKENRFQEEYYTNLLDNIKNLTLIYNKGQEEELRISRIKFSRKVIHEDFNYIINSNTYLNSLNQLEFAKTKYDLETFYIQNENYNRLYNTYNKRILRYSHEFNGISEKDLKLLLETNNTITPYKLESYYQCQFQFLLKNLLKIDNFEPNINQYLGNLSHKVLEELTKNQDVDYIKIINEFPDFPQEINYKEKIYKEAIKKEMDILVPIIKDIHLNTEFNIIKPEIRFKFPFKLDEGFYISGIIDKVMIKENKNGKNYFVLVDYKLSNKDFKLDDFNKNLKLQLPMYLYSYQELNNEDIKPLGFFYQTTALGRYKLEPKAIVKNYGLNGVALEDKDLLVEFNQGLKNINGILLTAKDNLRKSNRLLKESDFKTIEKQVEEKILEMIKDLKQGYFVINPLPAYGSNKDSESCKYCEYAGICYNKNKKRGGN